MSCLIYFMILSATNLLTISKAQTPVTVNLSVGEIQGWRSESNVTNSTYINVFRGIPYAIPPLGELRFKAPVPVPSWSTPLVLPLTDKPQCPQSTPPWISPSNTSEDCLYINVYTPETSSVTALPVMVWIYGGALKGGSSSYSNYAPDYLVQEGIIFVSFNYRVGALGFLNCGTKDAPGNAGLKDQNLALQWVKKEISNFGGDPEKVTLFGESAGSASVSFQYIAPKSQGLFSKAICESGNSFSETTFLANGYVERAKALSDQLNCTDLTGNINMTCLYNVNFTDIVNYQTITLSDEDVIPGNAIEFPVTPEDPSDEAIITDTPQNLLAKLIESNATRVPLIMGINHDEGTLQISTNISYYTELHPKLQYFIPRPIRIQKSANEIKNNAEQIFSYYFNNTEPSLDNLDGYIKLYGDKMFGVVTANFSRQIVNFSNIYLYHFDYSGGFKQANGPNQGVNVSTKVGHGEELWYIFYSASLNQTTANESSIDLLTLRRLVKMWTNFAKYGNPTPNNVTDSVLQTFNWKPISNTSLSYMRVTSALEMSSDNFLENEINFWNKIYTIDERSFGIKNLSSIKIILGVLLLAMLM